METDCENPNCQACEDRGWILAGNDQHGLRVERCDTCCRFEHDEQAAMAAWPVLSNSAEAVSLCDQILTWLEESSTNEQMPIALIEQLRRIREAVKQPTDEIMSHSKKRFVLAVDERELATILAALRFHQDENLQARRDIADQAIREIATNSGSLKSLDFDEIEKLCEKINTCQETYTSCQKEVWVLAVMSKNMIVHAQAYNSRYRAEKAMLDYLRSYEGYDGKDSVAKACDWLAKQEGTLRVDICSTQIDCSGASLLLGLTISPPPKDSGEEPLFRVVYIIDVNTADVQAAAEYTHRIMADPNSILPVLQVIDHTGKTVTVDLSEDENHIQKENGHG